MGLGEGWPGVLARAVPVGPDGHRWGAVSLPAHREVIGCQMGWWMWATAAASVVSDSAAAMSATRSA